MHNPRAAARCHCQGADVGGECCAGSGACPAFSISVEGSCDLRCPAMTLAAERTTRDCPVNCTRDALTCAAGRRRSGGGHRERRPHGAAVRVVGHRHPARRLRRRLRARYSGHKVFDAADPGMKPASAVYPVQTHEPARRPHRPECLRPSSNELELELELSHHVRTCGAAAALPAAATIDEDRPVNVGAAMP